MSRAFILSRESLRVHVVSRHALEFFRLRKVFSKHPILGLRRSG